LDSPTLNAHPHRPDHHILDPATPPTNPRAATPTPTPHTNPQADRPIDRTTLAVATAITADTITRERSLLWDRPVTRITDTDPHALTAALLTEDAELSLNVKFRAL